MLKLHLFLRERVSTLKKHYELIDINCGSLRSCHTQLLNEE